MNGRGIGSGVLGMVLAGLAVGSLGLLEPLLRFWRAFHLIGLPWPHLLLLYLGIGLLSGLIAGIPLLLFLAMGSSARRPIDRAAYFAMGTLSLAAVLFASQPLRHELIRSFMPVSYAILYPVLFLLAAGATLVLTPILMRPLLAGLVGTRSGDVSPPRLIILLLLVGLFVPLTVYKDLDSRYADSGRPPRDELRTRPSDDAIQNVLFITIDALRADHLSCYGYHRPTSPVIDSLAAGAIRFEQCISQGNRTELSVGSMFTSLYPSLHSVRHDPERASILPPGIETLAGYLRNAGLATSSMVSNPYVRREWGLARGFNRLQEFHFGYAGLTPYLYLLRLRLAAPPNRVLQTPVPRAEVIVDAAIAEIDHLREAPFFLYLHFMDVHHPYYPPPPYRGSFRSPDASDLDPLLLWTQYWDDFNRLSEDPDAIPRSHVIQVRDLYDDCIRYVDHELGRLFAALHARDLFRNTLIVLTADHGDEFLDHGDIFHKSMFLYDELVHVPLIVVRPGQSAGTELPHLVRHIDLLPTLLETFGLPASEQASGHSLLPLMEGNPQADPPLAFCQSHEFVAVRSDAHKLIYDLSAGRGFCFDLADDPLEKENLFGHGDTSPCDSIMRELMEFIRRISVPRGEETPLEIDENTRKQLESLGYM